jgi:UDPglucose 6-dehydrogenase
MGDKGGMRVSVIGCGYLGAVSAAAMASLGHTVIGLDVDSRRVDHLAAGIAPFYEPGLQGLLDEVRPTGRLTFSTDMAAAAECTVHFICVGTPQRADGLTADLTYVDTAVDSLIAVLTQSSGQRHTVVGKSTVPVGTAERIAGRLAEIGAPIDLVWNPEFLREGFAVADTLHPDRIVYGVAPGESGQAAVAALDEVYAPILQEGTPRLVMDYATAQLVKVAANSFLAVKISFINAMAVLCEEAGGDVRILAEAIGLDDRIGKRFLQAGLGYGGGCLPKDVRALYARATELGAGDTFQFLQAIDEVNTNQRSRLVAKVVDALDSTVAGKRIALLGAAFKPNSDDIRDSPAMAVARQLQALGAEVRIYDPAAGEAAARAMPDVTVSSSVNEAIEGVEAVIIGTEWAEFRALDPDNMATRVSRQLVIDGRNALPRDAWRAAGWHHIGVGIAAETDA